jgi:hypothetical protein
MNVHDGIFIIARQGKSMIRDEPNECSHDHWADHWAIKSV